MHRQCHCGVLPLSKQCPDHKYYDSVLLLLECLYCCSSGGRWTCICSGNGGSAYGSSRGNGCSGDKVLLPIQ